MADGAGPWAAGWQALRSGRSGEAERFCRQALTVAPDSAEGWFLLALACHSQGRPAEAAESYTQVLRLQPHIPEAHYNLGCVLRELGRSTVAAEHFQRALDLRPDFPEAVLNLGILLQDGGRPDEAAACFQRALALRPNYAEAHNNLGNILRGQGRPVEAAECFQRALALRPDFPEALTNLGGALRDVGRLDEAVDYFRRALHLQPNYAEAHYHLGSTLRDLRRPAEAVECHRRALALRPDYAEAHNNLAIALRDMGRPGEAAECLRRAVQSRPTLTEALVNLGSVLQELGWPDQAADCFRQALKQRPDHTVAHDGLLLALHYQAGMTPRELASAHAEYQRRHAEPLRATWQPHANDRDPNRPLRLGFVSADFGRHPVGFLLIRVLESLARRPVTIVCYSNRRHPADELTARFQTAAHTWYDVTSLNDEQLAEQVRADGIDILIDLAGHTLGNRLLTFARRPAPVQVTWLGYEGTTGLEAIDYLLADRHLIPPGADAHYRERVLRLPDGYACYDPPALAPEPGPLPALANGRVTFGCFNNPAKLTPTTIAAFAAVLKRVPESHLVLKYRALDDPVAGGRLRELFTTAGVGPERVEPRGSSTYADYLATYREIDIALDPFPFGGGVTTCDALWMGVPVVTLAGETFASRHGLSHLSSAGLAELATSNVNDYVNLAAELAHDRGRLAELRAGLRDRVARSPLCDGERFADGLLAVLRDAWRQWVGWNSHR